MSRLEISGQRFGAWLVLGPAGVGKHRQTLWSCLCDCGNAVTVDGNSLSRGISAGCKPCACRKATVACVAANTLSDAEVTYMAVHARLRAQRGPASTHVCECGEPAKEWAYQHGDPQERTELVATGTGQTFPLAFTPNLDAYEPMCRSCHWRLDRQKVSA